MGLLNGMKHKGYVKPCGHHGILFFLSRSITNIFGNSLNGIDYGFKQHIRVGAIAFI
jgi:hypothetical protein